MLVRTSRETTGELCGLLALLVSDNRNHILTPIHRYLTILAPKRLALVPGVIYSSFMHEFMNFR